MASTKVPIELSSTPGIVDNSNATAITIDSNENVALTGGLTLANSQYLSSTDASSNAPRMLGINSGNTTYIAPIDAYAGGDVYYGVSANVVNHGFYTAGSERLRIDSSGNVGIGTSSPATKLHVTGTVGAFHSNNDNRILMYNNGTVGSISVTYGTTGPYLPLTFLTGDTERMRIDSSGWVSINNTSRSSGAFENLAVDGWITSFDGTTTALFGASGSETYVGSFSNHSLVFRTNNAERMRIDTSGHLFVGCTSLPTGGASTGFAVSNNAGIQMVTHGVSGTANTYVNIYKNANGVVGGIRVNGSSTAYDTSSDYRLKENVVTEWDAITRLKQLKPSRFNFIADADTTVDGFLAHEVQDIVPEAISGVKDAVDADGNPEYQSIDHSKLVPLLTKAIQEQQVLIEQLQAEVALLKGE